MGDFGLEEGYGVTRLCGYVVMWLCGYVVMWLCGYMVKGIGIMNYEL